LDGTVVLRLFCLPLVFVARRDPLAQVVAEALVELLTKPLTGRVWAHEHPVALRVFVSTEKAFGSDGGGGRSGGEAAKTTPVAVPVPYHPGDTTKTDYIG